MPFTVARVVIVELRLQKGTKLKVEFILLFIVYRFV